MKNSVLWLATALVASVHCGCAEPPPVGNPNSDAEADAGPGGEDEGTTSDGGPTFDGGLASGTGPACEKWELPVEKVGPFALQVPSQALTGEVLNLTITSTGTASLDDYEFSWFVDIDDPPPLESASIVISYALPSRYRIQVQATNKSDASDTELVVGYVTVARPYADTVYALADDAPPQDVKGFNNPGSGGWCSYYYDIYYGKYSEFWLQQGVDVDRSVVEHALALTDMFWERNGEFFGWDYRALPSMRYTLCNDVVGGGAGIEGMFLNDWYTQPGEPLKQGAMGGMVHEYIHTWDFRGNSFLQGPDTAHVLTDAFERVLLGKLEWGFLGEYDDNLMWLDPWFMERVRGHYNLKRYLEDPTLDWNTYFSDELMSLSPQELWDTTGFPERQERMYVQAGFLSAIRDMHGDDALRRLFQNVDRILAADPAWNQAPGGPNRPVQERLANFVTALADALELDVAPYFDHWKVPLSDELRAYTGQYPESPMLDDQDGDGFSPLQGDLDDCDNSRYPGAPELADGKDNNGDGLVDEHIYDEVELGDIDVLSIELPALIKGEISSQDDTDWLVVPVPANTKLLVAIHPLHAPEPAPYAPDGEQIVSVYSGTVSIDYWNEPSITDWSSGEGRTIVYNGSNGLGTVIGIDAKDRDWANGVPGKYELQLVPDGYQPAAWDTASILGQLFP